MANGTYTFLIFAHETGVSDALNAKNSSLRTITISNETYPEISNILVNGSGVPAKHNLNTSYPEITLEGNITDPGYPIDAVVSTFIYRILDRENGSSVKDPICRRIEKSQLTAGSFSFSWDGRDDRGAFVPNGVYQIAITLREKTKSGYSHLILNDHQIIVETPLTVYDGELAPNLITQLPTINEMAGITVNTNITTFRCKTTKPCKVYLEVETPAGEIFTIGGVDAQGGSGSEAVIDWDGLHPASGLPVPVCYAGEFYKLRPYAIGTEPNPARVNYMFSSDGNDFYALTITRNEEYTNLTGIITPTQTTGNSDAIWSLPVNGYLWSFPALTTGVADINVVGKQVIEKNVDGTFSGTYLRFHERLKFKLRWRLQFGRHYYYKIPLGRDDQTTDDGYIILEKEYNVTFNDYYWWTTDPVSWQFDPNLNRDVLKLSVSEGDYGVNDRRITGPDPNGGYPGDWGSDDNWTVGYHNNNRLLWVQLLGRDENGNEVLVKNLFDSGNDPYFTEQPEPVTHANFFYGAQLQETPSNGRLSGSWLIDPEIFKNYGSLPTHNLTAGEEKISVIIGDNSHGIDLAPFEEGLLYVVNFDNNFGSHIRFDFKVPQGGTLTLYSGHPANLLSITRNISTSLFQPDKIPEPYRRQLVFDYDIRLDAGQTTDAQVVFPLPDRNLCTANPAACINCDVWDASHNYVYNRAIVADLNSCNLTLSHPSINLLAGNTVNSTMSSTLLRDPRFDYVIKNDPLSPLIFSFPRGVFNQRTTHLVNGNSHYLDWNISGNTMSVSYPKEDNNAAKVRWNISSSPAAKDPILEANGYSLNGYFQTGEDAGVYNSDGLTITKSFTNAPFTVVSNNINIFNVYAAMSIKVPSANIPSYTQGFQNDSWKSNDWVWPYLCWYDVSGNLRFHDGRDGLAAKGLTADLSSDALMPWGEISITYVDPNKVNDCFVLKNDTRNSGVFSLNIAPLAAPRRIVPVEVELSSSPSNLFVTDLLAFDSKAKNGSWENVALVQPNITVAPDQKTLLAYWDVTGKAGVYHLKLVAGDGTNSYQLLTTVKIGTEVPEDKTGTTSSPGFTAYSPLKKVELWFPPESPYKGMVGVDPIKLEQLRSVGFDGAPNGFLVDITPSGLVFDGPDNIKPMLNFYLTKEEVEQIGEELMSSG